jgi:hypothetical protein
MKTLLSRLPFGQAKFVPIRSVRYLDWENQFEVEFDTGDFALLPHPELRQVNRLPTEHPPIDSIWIDAETRAGFFVRYADGTTAEASWEFLLELPPEATSPPSPDK